MSALAAAGCAAAAAALVLPERPPVARLLTAVPGGPGRRAGRWPAAAALVAGLTVVVGPAGALLLAAAATAHAVWKRDAPARVRRRRVAATLRAAPLMCDLLSACVGVGLSLAVAARVVGSSVGEPISPLLVRLAQALERGVPVAEAVRVLDGSGLDALGRCLLAADTGGPGLGPALSSLAVEGRAAAGAAAQSAAKRSGIWAVGPLTLCFLPAFVLVGVVPVVAGLLDGVLR